MVLNNSQPKPFKSLSGLSLHYISATYDWKKKMANCNNDLSLKNIKKCKIKDYYQFNTPKDYEYYKKLNF